MYDKTFETDGEKNPAYDNFYKFKNTRTYLFATECHLYCRLHSNKLTYRLA